MKTKLFSLFLAVAASTSMWASDTKVDGIWYDFDSSTQTASVTFRGSYYSEYNEYSGSVVIPSSVTYNGTTYSVTRIGGSAFKYCSSLTSVTIPNSVTSIVYAAFSGCSSLTSVTIGNSVTSIGDLAFHGCSSLTSVTIPNSVTSIGDYAFDVCSSLTSVTIESEQPCNLGNNPFLVSTTIYVPCGTLSAYKSSWSDYSSQISYQPAMVKISELEHGYVYVGGHYWGRSGSSDFINICDEPIIEANPSSGYYFVSWQDGNTDNPRTIDLSKDVTYTPIFKPYTSGKCGDNLEWKYDNHKLTITGNGDMYDYVYDPDYLVNASPWTHVFIDSIASVKLPATMTSIGEDAFYGCLNITSVSIPNSVKRIGSGAFQNCTNLQNVVLPENLDTIHSSTFSSCSSLTSIVIPNTVKLIESYAFERCGLTSVNIPNSVISVEYGAFSENSEMETVILGNGLRKLYDDVFAYCTRISDIYCYAERVPDVQDDPFYKVSRRAYLYVPANRERNYTQDSFWGEFMVWPMEAEGVNVTQVQVTPDVNTADIAWPTNSSADTYELVITKDGVEICTLVFNAQGQLQSIAFKAPKRSEAEDGNRAPEAAMASGFKFTVTGLEPGTTYNYTLTVKDASDKVLDTKTGTFTTEGITAVENLLSQEELQALLANPATRIFNLQGNELTAMRDNLPAGVYILRLGNKAGKVVIR